MFSLLTIINISVNVHFENLKMKIITFFFRPKKVSENVDLQSETQLLELMQLTKKPADLVFIIYFSFDGVEKSFIIQFILNSSRSLLVNYLNGLTLCSKVLINCILKPQLSFNIDNFFLNFKL